MTGIARSPSATLEMAGGTMYGVTKAAIERFTQGLAQEVYEYGSL